MVKAIIIASYLLVINIVGFILFGIDKKRALNHEHRIPESTLLWMARLGGGLGCWLGMTHFHHKKKHANFLTLVPSWILIWMIIIVLLLAFSNGNASDGVEIIKNTLS